MHHWHNPLLEDFFVVTVVSNPVRYKKRYELYDRFAKMVKSAGVTLITVEQAFGDRPWMVTKSDNPFHLQVRSEEELWHKENMINIGIAHGIRLMPNAKYVAWIDADCSPAREPRDWFEEIWHELQHYEFVQCWESMIDLDNNFSPIGNAMPSFMANYIKFGSPNKKEFDQIEKTYGNVFGRPGLAWAANIKSLMKVGMLIDFSILGACDWYMAHGLVGSMKTPTGEMNSSSAYVNKLFHWQERCERWIKRDVGFVKGLVYHYWHGRKVNRAYGTRGKILLRNHYDPNTDIKYDIYGLIQLETWEPRQIKMRDEIRAYFRSRNEDCIYNGKD